LLSNNRMLNHIPKPITTEVLQIGNITFNPNHNNLQSGLNIWHLTARESELLKLLYQHKHDVVSRKVLLQKLWGDDNFFNARSLDVFITKLRKLLKADTNVQIINIRGVGYKLVW
jgi:DNA-binding response OmpR family regulator